MISAPTRSDLAGEIDRWRREGHDPLRLARLVGAQVERVGRHHLDHGLLTTLDALYRRHHGRNVALDAFLDAVLARRHDRFRNQTYLALPLLELVRADLGVDAELMSALLMADVVRHERRPEHASRLDARTRDTRIRHAGRFVATVDPALDLRWLPGPWFALTALPVSREDDEYPFIRALQAHEMVFLTLTDELRAATRALRERDLPTATAHVDRAGTVLERAAMLFGLVATMRPAAFHGFRRYTAGASAFRSEAYERFELACGRPTAQRVGSEAFENMPGMRDEGASQDCFSDAWRDLGVGGPAAGALLEAVGELESGHQRWRTTHHAPAASMLGGAHGSGHPEGVPYLRGCLDNRLFDLRGADAARPRSPLAA